MRIVTALLALLLFVAVAAFAVVIFWPAVILGAIFIAVVLVAGRLSSGA